MNSRPSFQAAFPVQGFRDHSEKHYEQEKATLTVLEEAELICPDWAA
jgi:hypothetical protein